MSRMASRSPHAEVGMPLQSAPHTSSEIRNKPPVRDQISSTPVTEKSQELEDLRWEYLTFETPLPELDSLHSFGIVVGGAAVAAPRAPDLNKYKSPFNWSSSRKTTCLVLSCTATFLAAYSAGSYSITSGVLSDRWNLSQVEFNTGLTTWALGFACSPMFLAPLSEISGRRPVFLFSGFMFWVGLIGCAVTDSFAGMLVARFFVGAGASTFATMVGGVVSDVYHAEHRNKPMAIYSASALAGTGFGPLLSGFIVTRTTWRWVFWHQVISLGVTLVALVVFFKETRGSVLLSRKARKINKYYGGLSSCQEDRYHRHQNNEDALERTPSAPIVRYKVAADEARASVGRLLYLSLTTPFKLLFTEPVVFFFSLWAAFAWGILYMQFNVIPLIYASNHRFSTEETGGVFAAIVVGTVIAALLSIYQEKLGKKRWPKMTSTPEGRLYFACLEAAFLPVGLFWFGWTTYRSVHWIVPSIALVFAQIGIFSIYLAVFNYLADVYHRYASSALACQSFCRNILGAVFPLFSQAMFRRLGFPAASSLLGGIAALLTVVPWVLVWNGEKIRAKSRIASEIMHSQAR